MGDKPIENAGDGKVYHMNYGDHKVYITVTDESCDITVSSKEHPKNDKEYEARKRTHVGTSIISELITMLIESGYNFHQISKRVGEQSQNKGDLADVISVAVYFEGDNILKKKGKFEEM